MIGFHDLLYKVSGLMESLGGKNRLIPAKAEIQSFQAPMDSCFRRNDRGIVEFLRNHQLSSFIREVKEYQGLSEPLSERP